MNGGKMLRNSVIVVIAVIGAAFAGAASLAGESDRPRIHSENGTLNSSAPTAHPEARRDTEQADRGRFGDELEIGAKSVPGLYVGRHSKTALTTAAAGVRNGDFRSHDKVLGVGDYPIRIVPARIEDDDIGFVHLQRNIGRVDVAEMIEQRIADPRAHRSGR